MVANLGAIYSESRQLKTDIPGAEKIWTQSLFRGSLWLPFRIKKKKNQQPFIDVAIVVTAERNACCRERKTVPDLQGHTELPKAGEGQAPTPTPGKQVATQVSSKCRKEGDLNLNPYFELVTKHFLGKCYAR